MDTIWTGSRSTDFSTSANWSGGIAPAAADSVFMINRTSRSPIVSASTTINSLYVEAGVLFINAAQTLTVTTLFELTYLGTLGGVGTLLTQNVKIGGGTVDRYIAITSLGGYLLTGGQLNGRLGGGGDFNVSGGIVNQGADGDFFGSGNLKVNSGADFTILGANTYTGNTTISGGRLALSGSGSIANSPTVELSNGGKLDISTTSSGASINDLVVVAGQSGTISLGGKTLNITAMSGDVGSVTFEGSTGADILTVSLRNGTTKVSLADAIFTSWSVRDTIRLTGNLSSNTLGGSVQNDLVIGGGGDDWIDGASGLDSAQFRGKRSEYQLNLVDSGRELRDLTPNRDGVDTLFSIERLIFSDGTLALDTAGVAGQVYRLYQAAFARTPDNTGLKYNIGLIDGGLSLEQMSAAFLASAEFQQKYGASPSDRTYINALYRNVLGRDADPAGLEGWLGRLDDGSWTRTTLLIGFSESPENISNVSSAISEGIWLV